MEYYFKDNNVYIKKQSDFSLKKTFDCGQCFRFERVGDTFFGIAYDRPLTLSESDDEVTLHNVSEREFIDIWRRYLDLDRDYDAINALLDSDPVIKKAREKAAGIRILRQEPWETVCSFIISQNNNIPRIKKIITTLCVSFGEPVDGGYTFPTAQKLAEQSIDSLAAIRSGFRAKYIIDAAKKVAFGEIKLQDLPQMPFEQAKKELLKIKGVGEKVACCILLFGLGFMQSFPKDVWINRAIQKHYSDGFNEEIYGNYGGIAQQYLFYAERF